MRYKRQLIWLSLILFVALNFILVISDQTNKVKRITYINEWTETKQWDMFETLSTSGVIDYKDEHLVFIDEKNGSFEAFSVEKGDLVNIGDPLYTYKVEHYYDMLATLENEVERLSDEVTAVETAISQMNMSSIEQNSITFVYPDDTEATSFLQNTSEAEMIKEQYLIEKEKEHAQLQAQLTSAESQLSSLAQGEAVLTVESPVEGKVTNLSETLENPIVTIESTDLRVIGELSEKERMIVETGMAVDMKLVERENQRVEFAGVVDDVGEEPKHLKLTDTSIYPFQVNLNEEIDTETPLLQGYHADLDITLKESLDAIVVEQAAIHDTHLWHMANTGKLVKQTVETGITMNGHIEIAEGADLNDWVAIMPEDKLRDNSEFITPLKPGYANWKEIYDSGPRKRSLLIGILGR